MNIVNLYVDETLPGYVLKAEYILESGENIEEAKIAVESWIKEISKIHNKLLNNLNLDKDEINSLNKIDIEALTETIRNCYWPTKNSYVGIESETYNGLRAAVKEMKFLYEKESKV